MDIRLFWKAVLEQDRAAIKGFLQDTAYVNWHCASECFTVDKFIQANYEYPGGWNGKVECVECAGNLTITMMHVFPRGRSSPFHVVSFFRIENEKIIPVDKYWSDGGEALLQRKEMCVSKPINQSTVSKVQSKLVMGWENG